MNPFTPFPPSVTPEWHHRRCPPPTTNQPTTTSSPATPSPHTHQAYTFHSHRFGTPQSTTSSSPSPCPSFSSSLSSPYRRTIIEIEELDSDCDSGIEILHGEFEDAPEDYGCPTSPCCSYDSDDEADEEQQEKRAVLHALRRLWHATTPSHSSPTRRKRCYAQSLDGSDEEDGSDSGNSTDSGSGGRIRRRRLAPSQTRYRREMESNRSTPEWMMDEMEL